MTAPHDNLIGLLINACLQLCLAPMLLHEIKFTEVKSFNTFVGYESWSDLSTEFSINWIDSLDCTYRWSILLRLCLGNNVCCKHSYDDHISYFNRPLIQ